MKFLYLNYVSIYMLPVLTSDRGQPWFPLNRSEHPENLSHFPGGGGRLQYEMLGCVCWGSENVPIMEDALGQKHTHIKGINTNIMV